jgi:hypothetical protein
MAQKHSGLGAASFIISVVVGVVIFLLILVAGVMELTTPGGINEESVGAISVGCSIIACLFVDLVALGLGIGGLFQRERKRIFADGPHGLKPILRYE